MKKRILVVNGHIRNCGVYEFASQFATVWQHSNKYDFFHQGFSDARSFIDAAQHFDAIILNWHPATVCWFVKELMGFIRNGGIRTFLIPHDEIVRYDETDLDGILYIDPTLKDDWNKKKYVLGRPLLPLPNKTYDLHKLLRVGFSGFSFEHKGIEKIIDIVGDLSCEICLHLSPSYWGNPIYIEHIKQFFKDKLKSNQFLSVNQSFMPYEDLIWWLHNNDVNVFPYQDDKIINQGISGIVDVALSAQKPFLISKSNMFRHLAEVAPKMTIGEVSIMDAVMNGVSHLQPYYDKWSIENNVKKIEEILDHATSTS